MTRPSHLKLWGICKIQLKSRQQIRIDINHDDPGNVSRQKEVKAFLLVSVCFFISAHLVVNSAIAPTHTHTHTIMYSG